MSLQNGGLRIYLVLNRFRGDDRRDMKQALISVTENEMVKVKEREATVLPLIPVEDKDWSSSRQIKFGIAVAGTTMFLLGGLTGEELSDPIDEMHFTSMVCSSCRDWKQGRPMKAKRSEPLVVSVDDKVYVFGGTENRQHWAEIYDIKTQRWSDLAAPASIRNNNYPHTGCLVDTVMDDGQRFKKILFFDDDNRLCVYDLIKRQWDKHYGVRHRLNPGSHPEHILLSGRMLFIVTSDWWVFDLGSEEGRGRVAGIHKIYHKLPLPRDCFGGPAEIIGLGCSTDGKSHKFLLVFSVMEILSVYVARVVVEDKVQHFSATLESLWGFRLKLEDFLVDHFYATTADMSSSEEVAQDGGKFAGPLIGLGAAPASESEGTTETLRGRGRPFKCKGDKRDKLILSTKDELLLHRSDTDKILLKRPADARAGIVRASLIFAGTTVATIMLNGYLRRK